MPTTYKFLAYEIYKGYPKIGFNPVQLSMKERIVEQVYHQIKKNLNLYLYT